MKKIKNVSDVVKNHLCTGCGVCSYMDPDGIAMKDDIRYGKRPIGIRENNELNEEKMLDFCPGWKLTRDEISKPKQDVIPELTDQWGYVIEVCEAYATDEEIRRQGSSGGVITALSLYCVEKKQMAGVLNTHAKVDFPTENDTSVSQDKEQLLKTAGSRYSPSSPCEKLNIIEDTNTSYGFVGKPCDVAAVQKVRASKEKLDKNLGIVISFFCAGVPSTEGVDALIKNVGVDKEDKIESLRFRGNGWPGLWTVEYWLKNILQKKQLTYQESWGFLQKYRQWRCYICPDHTGEYADISVGDPWYKDIEDDDLGKSLVLLRTEKGKELFYEAVKDGYITLEGKKASMLPESQPNLIYAKAVMWGRLFALRVSGCGVPKFEGFKLFEFWLQDLTIKQKFQSIFGTFKRVMSKKLYLAYSFSGSKKG